MTKLTPAFLGLITAATLTLTACAPTEPAVETALPPSTISTAEPGKPNIPDPNSAPSGANTDNPANPSNQTAPTPEEPNTTDTIATDFTITGVDIQTNIIYTTDADTGNEPLSLTLDLYAPVDESGKTRIVNQPAVLLIHGGAFLAGSKNLPHMQTWAAALAENGYVVAVSNYRLILSSPVVNNTKIIEYLNNADPTAALPAQSPPEALPALRIGLGAAIEDANAALTWLTNQGVNPDRIAIGGESAGAITALHLAYLNDTLNLNPTTPAAILNIYGAMSKPLSGGTEITSGEPALWTIHGTADTVVPYTAAEYLDQQTRAANIPHTLHTISGAAHGINQVGYLTGTAPNGTSYLQDSINFLNTHLK